MTVPHPHTSDIQGPNVWSTSTHQYIVMYLGDVPTGGELQVARRPHGGSWTTHTMAGAARTALGLPVTDDGHLYPMLCVHGHNGVDETDDVVHLFANMHSSALRYVVSAAGSISSWSSADLPGEQARNTYPVAVRVESDDFSGIYFHLRAGPENVGGVASADNRSGNAESRHWRMADGSSSWEELGQIWLGYSVDLDGDGPGSTLGHNLAWDTEQNFSAYAVGPFAEGPDSFHPGRIHLGWVWRAGVDTPCRSVVDAVTVSGDPTVTSATGSFTSADVGMKAVGPWIDLDGGAPRYVGAINSSTSIELSSSATSNVPANPVGNQTATRLTISRNRAGITGLTSGSPQITVDAPGILAAADVGAPVIGTGIPRGSYIGAIISDDVMEISSSSTSHVPVNATSSGLGIITIGIGLALNNINPSYMYSDDGGDSWFTIDGDPLTLPIEPYSQPECHIPFSGDPEGFLNNGGIVVDPATGNPHLVLSRNPHHHIWHDGADWQREVVGSTSGLTLDSVAVLGRINPYWIRGELWYLSTGGPSNARIPRLWKADGSVSVPLGGEVDSTGEWEAMADPEAFRLHNRVDVLTPDGDTPKVFSFGRGPRCRIAA